MENLVDSALEKRCESIKQLGDRLEGFPTLIDWERFLTVVGDLYRNQTEEGGRPNIDTVLMVKMLVLQSVYTLSDPELERQVNDRISFMKFLGYPNKVPDQTTIWHFRELRCMIRVQGSSSVFYLPNHCAKAVSQPELPFSEAISGLLHLHARPRDKTGAEIFQERRPGWRAEFALD
ncbi:MAG: hypothetical protein METHP_00922 [Methanoregula sp. SKADARSKE-2]|nr:MAG: hypothetical protein METHP_00922 [Methanoregula sp. SKADARSKE-2]